jgi:hypothetical protein
MAGGIAAAAGESLITGNSFGDTLMSSLPSIIGNTIGNLAAEGITGRDDPKPKRVQIAGNVDDATAWQMLQDAGDEIVVTARKLGDQAAQKGRGFFSWVDSWTGFNLSGNNPHNRSKKSDNIIVTFYQPGVRTGAGYDRMGQPLGGHSNYNAGRQFNNIISDAGNVSLGTTLGRIGEWGTYTVPDAAQRNAEIWDPYRGMTPEGRAFAMQSDRLTGGTISGIATGLSIQLGADPATQDLIYGLGSSIDGILIAGGSMAGARVPGIGNQRELSIVNGENGVHGNSRLSGRTTYLYELYQKDRTFLKYGISINPDTRYSGSFMRDKDIFRITSGTRSDMMALERQMVLSNPTGQLNREPWAVKARGGN